ncbi:MAG: RNA-binding protein [Chitinophagales bacterium]|nr:RNA-binding protein [Chitinophagales bacterium]
MNIFVGNLDYTVKESQIQELFEQFGSVSSVKIIKDKLSGKSRGIAFVEMDEDGEANTAISNLNGFSLKSRDIAVMEARPKEENKSSFQKRDNFKRY